MGTFAQHIAGSSATTFIYMYVHGLDRVFATIPFPEKWQYPGAPTGHVTHPDALVDETWEWSPTLEPKEFRVEQAISPWAGSPSPQRQSFMCAIGDDNWWLNILSKGIYRDDSAVAVLTADLGPGVVASVPVDSSTSFAASGYVYSGVETIEYDSKAGVAELTTLTRGCYLSPPTYHVANWPSGHPGASGPYVSDRPLTMKGRRVDVWVGTGHYDSDLNLIPNGTGPCTDADRCYSFVLDNARMSSDLLYAQLDMSDMFSLLTMDVARFLPRARLSPLDALVYVRSSDELVLNIVGSSGVFPQYFDFGEQVDYPDGYNTITGREFIEKVDGDYYVRFQESESGDGEGRALTMLIGRTDYAPLLLNFEIAPSTRSIPLLRALGFPTETTAIDYTAGVESSYTPDKPRALLSLTAEPQALGYPMLYEMTDTWPVIQSTDTVTPNAGETSYELLVRISEELMGCNISSVLVDGTMTNCLKIVQRGALGSSRSEHEVLQTYEENEDAVITQPVAITNRTLSEMLNILFSAGRLDSATFGGLGWYGFGAGVPDNWLSIPNDSYRLYNVILYEQQTLQSVIEPMLVLEQSMLFTDTTTGNLSTKRLPQPGSVVPTTLTLDHDSIDTNAGIMWDMPDDMMVTSIEFTNLQYNYGKEEGKELTIYNGYANATWGGGASLPIDAKAIQHGYDPLELADGVFVYWGSPYLILEFVVAAAVGLSAAVGDPVYVSHSLIPDVFQVRRGVTELPGYFGRLSQTYYSSTDTTLTTAKVIIPAISGLVLAGYAPCVVATLKSNQAGLLRLLCDATNQPYGDWEHVQNGDSIRVFKMGDRSGYVMLEGSVSSISEAVGVITIDTDIAFASLGSTAPWAVEFDEYDDCNDRQKLYMFMCNAVSPLRLGNDAPKHYG